MSEPENRGGSRAGAGRKPKLLTALLLEIPEARDDIAMAYGLFRDTMRDDKEDLDRRLDAAREILNRLCGKPAQSLQLSGEDGGAIEVRNVDRDAASAEMDQWRKQMTERLASLPTAPPSSTPSAPPTPPIS